LVIIYILGIEFLFIFAEGIVFGGRECINKVSGRLYRVIGALSYYTIKTAHSGQRDLCSECAV
jgi:hypothetical protein